MEFVMIFISAVLVNNIVLAKFLGVCPFLGVSKKVETSIGMGMAVTFVMTLATLISYIVYNFILVPLNIEYLSTIAFILVIASLVQLVEMIIQKTSPALYQALGVYLPLITTNCAVLGIALINMNKGIQSGGSFGLIHSVVNGFGTAAGLHLQSYCLQVSVSILNSTRFLSISKVTRSFWLPQD